MTCTTHYCDNQGRCHYCGILMEPEWWAAYTGEPMMARYSVTYEYRTDDGMAVSTPTHHDSVIVEAPDAATARHYAIDAAYQKHRNGCSHVTIRSVMPAA